MKKLLIIPLLLLGLNLTVCAQSAGWRSKTERQLVEYFSHYQPKEGRLSPQPKFKKMEVDSKKKTVRITVDGAFAQQDFTNRQVGKIYKKVRNTLPKPYRKYKITVVTNGMAIEDYVPGHISSGDDVSNLWGRINYDDEPWVENISRPYRPTHGLYDRHITLWQSHGRYYDHKKGIWKWQRPFLFCTTEDLFTQTIVVPYLIPMLENAGAVVFTPRERDWQTEEYIVDPDGGLNSRLSDYDEYAEGRRWGRTPTRGFACHSGHYVDNVNPFQAGSARMIKATKKDGKAYVKYQPSFQKAGRYAVYVSYQTLDNSVEDAHYTVFHKGQATEFRVNQKMGGGTWVYLGTFEFDKGNNIYNCVMLTNQSRHRGVVTADAVRFGGGMGNIERGGTISGYPRALEGARYWSQWAGAPYTVYSKSGGTDDYADDINSRSKMLNWLAGGSCYVPTVQGLNVPMELSLAIHSDAGFAPNGEDIVGSLTICTTNFNNGQLSSGITRQASKQFADALLTNTTRDLTREYGKWNRRYLWDRNYSETRLPEVPSAIFETLSHQNFPDMVKAQDPNFRFSLARSIYKTILRYVNGMHGRRAVVQPLQPQNLRVEIVGANKARISWSPQTDQLEPTAAPNSYNLYTAAGTSGFDNGVNIKGTSTTVELQPGVCYNFRVTAVNRGGESFPSEVVSASVAPRSIYKVLIVNGFKRLSAPAVINNNLQQGFDLDADPGVSYGLTAGWSGRQICFDRSQMGHEGPGGLGYSGNELAGNFIAGNDFNYTTDHANALTACQEFAVSSCSLEALESGLVKLSDYDAVDFYTGLQRYMPDAVKYYRTFSTTLQRLLKSYTYSGGRLLVSGAYLGSDMQSTDEKAWLADVCKSTFDHSVKTDTLGLTEGLGMNFDFVRRLNPDHYAATHSDVLHPVGQAICSMRYSSGEGAAVAYDGKDYKAFVMGFPFECITEKAKKQSLMKGIMAFLLRGKTTK